MARRVSTPWPTEAHTVFFDDVASRDTLSRAVARGRIRRLAPRLYSADLISDPAEIVAANRWLILGRILPGAVIVDRSAAANGGVDGGCIFMAAPGHRKSIRLPGMEVQIRSGGPLAEPVEDPRWAEGLRMSSQARILVDNLAITHGRGGRTPRTLSLAELEDWLAKKAVVWGSERMLRLKEDAAALAEAMGVADRVEKINRLFNQLAGQQPLRPTAGRLLQALTRGRAWDGQRVEMFKRLIQGVSPAKSAARPGPRPVCRGPGRRLLRLGFLLWHYRRSPATHRRPGRYGREAASLSPASPPSSATLHGSPAASTGRFSNS